MENKTQKNKIEITQFTDYVDYIKELIEYKREAHGFSFRVFCRLSGFKSSNYLKWVVERVRPISLKSVHKFVSGLSLDKREAQYFMLMVNYKEAKDPEAKRFYYEQMLAWQQKRVGALTKDAYEYLSHWYYLAIRELIGSKEFNEDPNWIRNRLGSNLTLWDIKNSLDTLIRLKLIRRDEKGCLRQTTKDLHTEKEITSLAAYNYHVEMLDLAQNALTKRKAEERHYQSLVALINKKTYAVLKDKIQNFQQELIQYLEKEENNSVKDESSALQELYALNLQMFPLTKHEKQKGAI